MGDTKFFGTDFTKWLICKRKGDWTICPPKPEPACVQQHNPVLSGHPTGESAFAEFRWMQRKARSDA